MTVISESKVDARPFANMIMAAGGTPLLVGILMSNIFVVLAGVVVIAIGALLFFKGKSTYTVTYDEKAGVFNLESRQETVRIRKDYVTGVNKKVSVSQFLWPFPRPFFYVLSAKPESGRIKNYRFVIWSNESNLLKSYEMLKRSVDAWKQDHSR